VKHFLSIFVFLFFASLSSFALDAMVLYNAGKSLDRNGRAEDARVQYNKAIEVCITELETASNVERKLDAYSVYLWSLINLKQYEDALKIAKEALKIRRDHRIIEVMGEAYFYLKNYRLSLKFFQEYATNMPNVYRPDVAYFFIGEIYQGQKKHAKAELAYSMAINYTDYRNNPQIALWWYKLATMREEIMDKEDAQDRRAVINTYTQVLRYAPRYPGVQEKIKSLQAIR